MVADRRPVARVPCRGHAHRARGPSRARRRLGTVREGNPRRSWLGLTPSRSQSGEHDYHGSITKTGSQLARRLLVEAAWHYGREPRVGATLANRQEGQPDHILQISNRCQHRLHHLYTSMRARGKHHNVTTVAVARELSCFLWAAATAPCSSRFTAQTAAPPRLRRPGRRADTAAGTRNHAIGNTRLRVPRSFLDPRTAGSRNRAMGYQKNPRISDWQRRHRARRPALLRQPAPPSPRPVHGETSACPLESR